MVSYRRVLDSLRLAYDDTAQSRNDAPVEAWKVAERSGFLVALRQEGCSTLLDVGSGPGLHALFFSNEGIQVTCVDLSPEHARLCREKGLKAEVNDFLSLDFGEPRFDAAFALNSLLHVPKADLREALRAIHRCLKPQGLFYLGQYGGVDYEGIREDDSYRPRRFFSHLSDERLKEATAERFDLVDFRRIGLRGERELVFQALLLRARPV